MERVLEAELAGEAQPKDDAPEPTWVIVHCLGSDVLLEVHDPRSGRAAQRRLEFSPSEPKPSGRLIGIAAAELVLASWSDSAGNTSLRSEHEQPDTSSSHSKPQPTTTPDGSPAPSSESSQAPRIHRAGKGTVLLGTDPRLAREGIGPRGERILYGDYVWERAPARVAYRVVALGSTRNFVERLKLFGAGARFGADFLPLHCWAFDALVEAGTLRRPREGTLRLETWTLGGTLCWVSELSPKIITLRGGAGLRGGIVRTSQGGDQGKLGSPAFWGWPMLTASTSVYFGRLTLDLSTEAGYTQLPLSSGTEGASIRGIWLSAQLGLGLRL